MVIETKEVKVSWPVDCANCGKQVLIEGQASVCYWCGKNATKKEEKPIAESKPSTRGKEHPAPPRPKKRYQLAKYFEDNKEAIIADYYAIALKDFFERWHTTSNTWLGLKRSWGVTPKENIRSTHPRPAYRPAAVTKPRSKPTPLGVAENPAPRKYKRIVRLSREYLEEHKAEIIADYYSIAPIRKFLEKHHLSPKHWKTLKVDWKVSPKGHPGAESRAKDKGDSPPTLPPFNNDWNFLVQIEWLQTYKELKLAGKLSGSDKG